MHDMTCNAVSGFQVSKMSSFYGAGDLNTSLAGRKEQTRSLSRDKNEKHVLRESFRVPTVYRIGSLHLSEGVLQWPLDCHLLL